MWVFVNYYLLGVQSNKRIINISCFSQEGRRHWAVYYTGTQSFIIICWFNHFGDFYWILIGWFTKFSFQSCQPLILIYRTGNFLYHHYGCTSVYRPLSYPFKSLYISPLCLLGAKLLYNSIIQKKICWNGEVIFLVAT